MMSIYQPLTVTKPGENSLKEYNLKYDLVCKENF